VKAALAEDRRFMSPAPEQARLESAIFDRLGSLAYGHTPGSVESTIRWVEPRSRSIVIHTGEGFDRYKIAAAVTPEFCGGTWANGIPALRSGPSNRGVVLYRDGIDAAVVLAGVSYREWCDAVKALEPRFDGSYYFTYGRVGEEEATGIPVEARWVNGYGSVMLRHVGALQALPHTSIDTYSKSPGLVVEIVQHEVGEEARGRLGQILDEAGLAFDPDRSSTGEQATLIFQSAIEEEPLLVRLVVRPVKFPA